MNVMSSANQSDWLIDFPPRRDHCRSTRRLCAPMSAPTTLDFAPRTSSGQGRAPWNEAKFELV